MYASTGLLITQRNPIARTLPSASSVSSGRPPGSPRTPTAAPGARSAGRSGRRRACGRSFEAVQHRLGDQLSAQIHPANPAVNGPHSTTTRDREPSQVRNTMTSIPSSPRGHRAVPSRRNPHTPTFQGEVANPRRALPLGQDRSVPWSSDRWLAWLPCCRSWVPPESA
jgi:hypothetical protein